MATITLTIPDDQLERVVDALCALHGFEDNLDPPSKGEFARLMVKDFLAISVSKHEGRLAAQAASASAEPLIGIEFGE